MKRTISLPDAAACASSSPFPRTLTMMMNGSGRSGGGGLGIEMEKMAEGGEFAEVLQLEIYFIFLILY